MNGTDDRLNDTDDPTEQKIIELVKRLIEKVDKCEWTKNFTTGLYQLEFKTSEKIAIGSNHISVFNKSGDLLVTYTATGAKHPSNRNKLEVLYNKVSEKVDAGTNDFLLELIKELDRLNDTTTK